MFKIKLTVFVRHLVIISSKSRNASRPQSNLSYPPISLLPRRKTTRKDLIAIARMNGTIKAMKAFALAY